MSENFYIPKEWNQWKLNRVIGQSQTGSVALVQKSDGQKTEFAYIKKIDICGANGECSLGDLQPQIMALTDEVNLINELKCENIIGYEECIIKDNGGSGGCQFFVRMEFAESLAVLINDYGSFSETDVIKLGIDLCAALEILENRNIALGNINPGNIFCGGKGNYKLGGMGILGQLDSVISGNTEGFDVYFGAPEVLSGSQADKLSDIYSVGSVMYYLLNGSKPPFVSQNSAQISYRDRDDCLNGKMSGMQFASPLNCKNKYLENVISTACEFNPDNRWKTPSAMKKALIMILKDESSCQEREQRQKPTSSVSNSQYYKDINAETESIGYSNEPQRDSFNDFGIDYADDYAGVPENNMEYPSGKRKSSKTKLAVIISLISGAAAVAVISVLLFIYPGFLMDKISDNIDNSHNSQNSGIDDSTNDNDSLFGGLNGDKEEETQKKRVYVPNVTGMSLEDAEENLTANGLKMNVEYAYNDNVAKDDVISQSPKGGNKAEEGFTVDLVVSLGAESRPSPEYYSQKIEVNTSGTYATMELLQWNGSEWESLFYTSNVRIGENGASYNYGEGKKTTPKGTFDIGFCYGLSKPDTGLRFKQLTSSSVFVDDPYSPYYNMLVDRSVLSGDTSYENTYEQFTTKNYYSTCIFIEHNGDGETIGSATPNMGSVITICGKNGGLNATFGCVDISSEDMSILLRYLDESQNPVIIIS